MTGITWATDELADKRDAALLLAGIVPYECLATKIDGVWESRHYNPLGELIRHVYERELFTVVEYGTSYDYNSDQYTYIRFRLPVAPVETAIEAAVPRYYVEKVPCGGVWRWTVNDGAELNATDKPTVVDSFWWREKAEAHCAELNAYNASTTIPEPSAQEHPAIAELKALKPDELSPIEAMTKLYELKRLTE